MFEKMMQARRERKDQAALQEIERQCRKFSTLPVLRTALFRILVHNSSVEDLEQLSHMAGRVAHEKARLMDR